jgi:hypothetical protein
MAASEPKTTDSKIYTLGVWLNGGEYSGYGYTSCKRYVIHRITRDEPHVDIPIQYLNKDGLQSPVARRLTSFYIVVSYDVPAAKFQFAHDNISADLHPGLSSAYPCLQHLTMGCSYLESFPEPDGTRELHMPASH